MMRHLKEEFDKLTFREVALHVIGVVSLVAAFVLLFLGLFIPPEGEIHESVLTAFGITLLFVASIYGITVYFVSSLRGFKDSVIELLRRNDVDAGALRDDKVNINLDKE